MGKILSKTEYDEMQELQRLARYERYMLQSVAKKALPLERVSFCLRRMVNKSFVDVYQHVESKKAFYGNLMSCGSVWNCPVCASKISERRRMELRQAFYIHKEGGGKIAHLVLTFSHSRFDVLRDILDRFLKAVRRFQSGKRYNCLRQSIGFIGTVRTFEITWSERNGFHPHVHMAIFYSNDVDLLSVYKIMNQLWLNCVAKEGLSGMEGIALKLQSGEDAEEYFTKWSLESELSKSHIKKGKLDSLTPFDFLREYIKTEDRKFIDLFAEYASAMKQKNQMLWSRGLKRRFLLEEKSDEEVANERIEKSDFLGQLTYDEWKEILRRDRRADFLSLVEKFGFEEAKSNIFSLEVIKKKESSCLEDSHGFEI